ncbi:hypothetical protein QE385_002787 [Sphingomonas sp. SORGH_AS 950]|uniref:hypothetical protein n=1 Tax=Sphingomonas sp. SORGH_AS_0950 TaxID=3041792 RepID=UPI00278A5492|nr:hypothetical protein [Sphingomonas sp. SORGH_AS_0950]MDQ1158460.1 hypothetical protein [Sphingomonas sp. SORGH_AS_0950]
MKNFLKTVPMFSVIGILGCLTAPQPAAAMPSCEQEVRIRCSGHDVQGRPRLDTRHSSYEECVEEETAWRCTGGPSFWSGGNDWIAFRREGDLN